MSDKTDPQDFNRALLEPDLLGTGIVSGPGNQGSSNTAHLVGQAGTGGTYLSLPRQIGRGGIGGAKP
jgi:hypothetical protein